LQEGLLKAHFFCPKTNIFCSNLRPQLVSETNSILADFRAQFIAFWSYQYYDFKPNEFIYMRYDKPSQLDLLQLARGSMQNSFGDWDVATLASANCVQPCVKHYAHRWQQGYWLSLTPGISLSQCRIDCNRHSNNVRPWNLWVPPQRKYFDPIAHVIKLLELVFAVVMYYKWIA
jgi:hypothetical protein